MCISERRAVREAGAATNITGVSSAKRICGKKIGSSIKHKYGSESKALDKSGVIKVKIPLKLPDLKVDLKGAPAGQSYGDGPVAMKYGCPLNLQWENSGVNTCTASNTASNSIWSGLLVKDMGLTLKSGTKKLTDIVNPGDYSLTCSRYLGSSLWTAEKKMVAVSVSSKPAVTLQAKNLTSSGVYADETLEINKGDKIELKWSATDASSCKLYRLVGNKRANEALKETSGNLTINGLYDSAVYEMECYNTYVQDSATSICSSSKTEDTVTIKVLEEEPPPPTNLTAVPDCDNKKITVNWTDTADTASNTATSKKNYYTFQRDSETSTTLYTNSYTDSDVSDGSSYDYKVNACNTNGCSKQSSVSATYSCSPDDDTVTPPPGGTVTRRQATRSLRHRMIPLQHRQLLPVHLVMAVRLIRHPVILLLHHQMILLRHRQVLQVLLARELLPVLSVMRF